MTKDLCIYHHNCADGFGAAWVVWDAFGRSFDRIDFHPGVYQQEPPDVTGRHVYLVDFSYKRPVVEKMLEGCASLTIIDHHKSAIADLENLEHNKLVKVFSLDKSGASLTWDFFNQYTNQTRPPLIDHIEDRDLWRFKLEGTREIQANVFSYPYDFKVWDELMALPIESLRTDGKAIERKHFKDINEILEANQHFISFVDYEHIPCCNMSYIHSSDAGHAMLEKYPMAPFVLCYWFTPSERPVTSDLEKRHMDVVFSLRSKGLADVSEVAKEFGGGGHKAAAGFRVSYDTFCNEFEVYGLVPE